MTAVTYSCFYTISTGGISVSSGATCTVQPVNDGFGNFRMVITAPNTTGTTALQVKIEPNGNASGAAYASAYCPQIEQASVPSACMLTGSKAVTRAAGGNQPYTLFSESGAATETLAPSSQRDIFTGTITSATLYMPPNPVDGTPKTIACDIAISTLSVGPTSGSGWTVNNAPTSCAAGKGFTFLPDLATKTWYLVQ